MASGGLDIAACAAAGLAHDIGHCPYGHPAGRFLDSWLREKGGDGFEGNAQTLRSVTLLDNKPDSVHGLDLTAVTLCALLKYPYERRLTGDPLSYQSSDKFSLYADSGYHGHNQTLNFARQAVPIEDYIGEMSGSDRQSLEASIVSLADDITYATHDLEDFVLAGVLKASPVLKMLQIAEQTYATFELEELDALHPNIIVRETIELARLFGRNPIRDAIRRTNSHFRPLVSIAESIDINSSEDSREFVTQILAMSTRASNVVS